VTQARPDLGEILGPWLARFTVPDEMRRVIVGCSGGADSLALLALAAAAGRDVTAVHVDHGLRVGSAGDQKQADQRRADAVSMSTCS